MMLEVYPQLVLPMMEASAEIAAVTYDALGDSDFAEIADLPDEGILRKSVSWALAVGDPISGLDLLNGSTDRRIWSSARDTMIQNATREEGARFGRQYNGNGKCDFCPMLASRGAVYHTADSAGDTTAFHDNCHCTIFVDRP